MMVASFSFHNTNNCPGGNEGMEETKMKVTCVSMDCPFMGICREYNFLVDRSNGCKTQKFILEKASEMLERKGKENKRNKP